MKIHILPSFISDQIAAGEVVERPASVVKELVENSLDAGSSFIQINIEEGGIKRIEVRDEGQGMPSEDLELSVLRHATSKINTIDDIFTLQSFGFRGEALAAIAAVSKCVITSRTPDVSSAQMLRVVFGQKFPLEETAGPVGTTLLVEDLFGSVPARKKYLRSERVEFKALYREVVAFALANPSVGFKFSHNKKIVFEVLQTSAENRVLELLPLKDGIIPVHASVSSMKVHGFLSKPDKAQKTKNHQYLFVNGRHIEDKRLGFALRDVYTQTCGLDKALHPPFVLFLEIDPLLVDVNVHPRKTEVQFSDPRDVYSFVFQSARNALGAFSAEKMHNVSQKDFGRRSFSGASNNFSSLRPSLPGFSERSFARESLPIKNSLGVFQNPSGFEKVPRQEENIPHQPVTELRLVGQVAQKYIVAESDEGLFIFDQHALHERIRFEMLLDQVARKKIEIQPLLLPQFLSLSPDQKGILEDHSSVLEDLGIHILFQENGIEIQALPQLLEPEPLDFLFQDMVLYFEEEQTTEHSMERLLRILLEFKSCRGSVKFGDRLEKEEMEQLLHQYQTLDHKLLCPHGRPNHVFLNFEDLDKSFYR